MATILKSPKYTLASYLDRIREHKEVLMKKPVLNEYERSVSVSLGLTIEQIERDEDLEPKCRKLCTAILVVVAYCEQDWISESLFLALAAGDKKLANDAAV